MVSAAIAVSACAQVDNAERLTPVQLDLLDTYTSMESSLDSLLEEISQTGLVGESLAPGAARLWTADSRLGPWLLSGGVYENRTAIAALKEIGISQLDVVVAYPVLTGDEIRAEEFRAFYEALADLVKESGLKLRVIVGPQYRGAMYMRGVPAAGQCDGELRTTFAQHASRVAGIMQPDFLTLDINVESLESASGCFDFADPELAAMLALSVAENVSLPPETRLGITGSASDPAVYFSTLLESDNNFFIDANVRDFRSRGDNDIARLRSLAAMARENGRDIAVGSYWLKKDKGVLNTPADPDQAGYSPVHAARDTLNIWADVDRKMHTLMREETDELGLLYASAYQSELLFTYLEPGSDTINEQDPVKAIRLVRGKARAARIEFLKGLADTP